MFPYAVQMRTLLEEHFTLFYDILKDHSMVAIKELTARAKDSEDPVAYLQQKKGTLYVHVLVVQYICILFCLSLADLKQIVKVG